MTFAIAHGMDTSSTGGTRSHGPRLFDVVRERIRTSHYSRLRLLECAELRVKDLDLRKPELRIRDGKGRTDRVTLIPARLIEPLTEHMGRGCALHEADLGRGDGWVLLPDALARKYPEAGRGLRWQWVFPATRTFIDRPTGHRCR